MDSELRNAGSNNVEWISSFRANIDTQCQMSKKHIVICLVGKSLIAKATKPQCWSLLPRREEAIQETILSPITPQTVLNRTERCCVALHIYWIVFNLIQNTST